MNDGLLSALLNIPERDGVVYVVVGQGGKTTLVLDVWGLELTPAQMEEVRALAPALLRIDELEED